MSTDFERVLYGWRRVEVGPDDSLQLIALREMGDASRWAELIAINNLVYPYITTDPAEAGPGVVLAGGTLRVPAPTPFAEADRDGEEVFLRDLALQDGKLTAEGGAITTVGGRANLRQALRHLLMTDTGELMFHPTYGCGIRRLLGAAAGPTVGLLAAQYVRTAVAADERIDRVTRATAAVSGDSVRVEVDAMTVAGRPIDLAEVI